MPQSADMTGGRRAQPRARIDDFLPRFDVREFHSLRVRAPRERVWRAILEMRAGELPAVRWLVALRRLEARALFAGSDAPILQALAASGFVELVREPGSELVLGVVGQFWRLRPRRVRFASGEEFVAFERPGFAKAVMDFRVADEGGGSRLSTETRVRAGDASARRRFALYWSVVHPGSALIRRVWLRAVRRRAERG